MWGQNWGKKSRSLSTRQVRFSDLLRFGDGFEPQMDRRWMGGTNQRTAQHAVCSESGGALLAREYCGAKNGQKESQAAE